VGVLKRGLLVVAVLLGAVTLVGVAGSLLSLDWSRAHRTATERLPRLSPSSPDGHVRIPANGMTFRARVAGLAGPGPGLILLHGFPETSAMWEPLVGPAVAAGYRVVALDQRGYSPGARPEGVGAYLVPELAGDVLAVAEAVGFDRFHLVGHDWGCVVGWSVAIERPERVSSWTGLSIPHPGTLLADLRREPPTYIRIFTAPWLPEIMLSFNGLARLRKGYDGASEAQRAEYLAVFAEPGALTAALNWYRGITAGLDRGDEIAGSVAVDTRFIWGSRELWVTPEALARQRELVTGPYSEVELDAGHFLLREKPQATVAAVLEHLRAAADRRGSP
jgi:pimeloyl-ACP methyl ester carboxylesterase